MIAAAATTVRYEWMLAPDWDESHRVDWDSISYIPHAQAQRATTVCGKRLTLRGEVIHGPSDSTPCRGCVDGMAKIPHFGEVVRIADSDLCADGACNHDEWPADCPGHDAVVCGGECQVSDTGDFGSCDRIFSQSWPCRPGRKASLTIVRAGAEDTPHV